MQKFNILFQGLVVETIEVESKMLARRHMRDNHGEFQKNGTYLVVQDPCCEQEWNCAVKASKICNKDSK